MNNIRSAQSHGAAVIHMTRNIVRVDKGLVSCQAWGDMLIEGRSTRISEKLLLIFEVEEITDKMKLYIK